MRCLCVISLTLPMVLSFRQICLPIRWNSARYYTRSSSCYLAMMSSNLETHRTLAPGSHFSEMEVKKSRFLGYAKHVENWSDAQSYIEEIKREHPKGRHWCYAFRAGVNPVSERCSDDGEPTGTAGQPILGK